MGVIRSEYKKAILEDVVTSITGNTSIYYAFASNPTERTGNTPVATADDYLSVYENNWNMLFGKKIANNDAVMMIRHIPWTTNTVYTRYDNTVDLTDEDFYVVVPPGLQGGYYHIYKCIDNAQGNASTVVPSVQDYSTYTLTDGYSWRYIYSISTTNYNKFGNDDYVPVTPNAAIVAAADTYAGIDVVRVANGGNGYSTYHSGNVQAVSNSTLIKIETTASTLNDFYTNSAIYIYNDDSATSQLRVITEYNSNTTGRWVTLSSEIDTSFIDPLVTAYTISPQVVFDTDGRESPAAYSVINTVSNSISQVIVVEPGYSISRAEATIVANSAYGSGANLVCIVPPPGGHGYNPIDELKAQAVGITFSFLKSENDTIPVSNTTYNKIGIIKNPYELSNTGGKSTVKFSGNTFDQRTKMVLTPSLVSAMDKDAIPIPNPAGAKGKVVFSNLSVIYVVGDKTFEEGETISSTTSGKSAAINITHAGDIFAKTLVPLYTDNINDVTRDSVQSEVYKIVIQV